MHAINDFLLISRTFLKFSALLNSRAVTLVYQHIKSCYSSKYATQKYLYRLLLLTMSAGREVSLPVKSQLSQSLVVLNTPLKTLTSIATFRKTPRKSLLMGLLLFKATSRGSMALLKRIWYRAYLQDFLKAFHVTMFQSTSEKLTQSF